MTRILVIEENRSILENILEVLALEQLEARGVRNSKDGLDLAFTFSPDLIVWDISTLDTDRGEVLTSLRRTPQTSPFCFLFLATNVRDEAVHQGMNLSADDYLVIPFSAPGLLTAIRTQLTKCQG